MKNVYFIILSLFCILIVIKNVRQERFSIKESFWWTVGSIAMLFLAIFPRSIDKIANIIGVSYPPSLLFVFCIIFLTFLIFRNSKLISQQQEKIKELSQHISIIKEKLDEKKK